MVAGTTGWHASRAAKKTSDASTPSALDDRATLRASTLPVDEGDDPLPKATSRDDPPADDEENPLPPAIESGAGGAGGATTPTLSHPRRDRGARGESRRPDPSAPGQRPGP